MLLLNVSAARLKVHFNVLPTAVLGCPGQEWRALSAAAERTLRISLGILMNIDINSFFKNSFEEVLLQSNLRNIELILSIHSNLHIFHGSCKIAY